MPLLTLEQISHAYGHLPLLDRAALRQLAGYLLKLIAGISLTACRYATERAE